MINMPALLSNSLIMCVIGTKKHKEPISCNKNTKVTVYTGNRSAAMSKTGDATGSQEGNGKKGFLF